MYVNYGSFFDYKVYKEEKEEKEFKCSMDAFFRAQESKPPWLRSAGALLVCRCPKCSRKVIC